MQISLDTETFLICPGLQAPPVVCVQTWADGPGFELRLAKEKSTKAAVVRYLAQDEIHAHNACFDMACISHTWPDLMPAVFKAYREDRITCTQIRAQMIDIALGLGLGRGYDLASCCQRAGVDVQVDKTDPWRLRYGTLADTPVLEWPEGAVSYAKGDVLALRALYDTQEEHAPVLRDQYRQARAGFMLYLMTCWGFRTDGEYVQKLREQTLEGFDQDNALLQEHGLVRLDGTRDTKRAQRAMEDAMTLLGERPQLTAGGAVSLAEEACLASGDEVLLAYQRFGSRQTILARVERLAKGAELPLQPSYRVLVETGRTSCREPPKDAKGPPMAYSIQAQNFPRASVGEYDQRGCVVPRPGYVLCSVDYDGIELRSWAQVCLWAVGFSKMAEALNAGVDPHLKLGARINGQTLAQALVLTGKERADTRQGAKIANFGLMGLMSARRFRQQARVKYGLLLSEDEAESICRAWKEEWPESEEYFQWIRRLLGPGFDARGTIQHFRSSFVRGGVKLTEACNSFFQGLAASAWKEAGFHLAQEMYTDRTSPLFGSRALLPLHDEYILEVPIDQAHEAGLRQAEVMRSVAQEWMPDVKITCSPALMSRWTKGAETKFDDQGRLVVDR